MDKRAAKHLACDVAACLIDEYADTVGGPMGESLQAALRELRDELQHRAEREARWQEWKKARKQRRCGRA